ncbi:MAG: DsrE/DsrF/DrsH-like family protein, partial [Pseudomonadota bacterium]
IIFCRVGFRGYLAYRLLIQEGLNNIFNLSGGYLSYQMTFPAKKDPEVRTATVKYFPTPSCQTSDNGPKLKKERLDLTGLQCPGPILRLKEKLSTLPAGVQIEAIASDLGFCKDLPAFCKATGDKLISLTSEENNYLAVIERGEGMENKNLKKEDGTMLTENKKTLVVFSNDLDKAMASFIIANGARAMGSEVTMFFTFWGLNLLRQEKNISVSKTIIEKMFGWMMAKGPSATKLSKMNMMGMGTIMMKWVMGQKKVASLSELVALAMASGIKMIACSMTMDVMGLKKEELLEGVEIGGVAQYLGDAQVSNLNLFI